MAISELDLEREIPLNLLKLDSAWQMGTQIHVVRSLMLTPPGFDEHVSSALSGHGRGRNFLGPYYVKSALEDNLPERAGDIKNLGNLVASKEKLLTAKLLAEVAEDNEVEELLVSTDGRERGVRRLLRALAQRRFLEYLNPQEEIPIHLIVKYKSAESIRQISTSALFFFTLTLIKRLRLSTSEAFRQEARELMMSERFLPAAAGLQTLTLALMLRVATGIEQKLGQGMLFDGNFMPRDRRLYEYWPKTFGTPLPTWKELLEQARETVTAASEKFLSPEERQVLQEAGIR